MASRSPWLQQLHRTRGIRVIEHDGQADVVIVGGGIAGIVTAREILRLTNKSVTLLEAGRVAHGATGHNAGQVVSYFERPFSSIVQEFGLARAAAGVQEVKDAWKTIDNIYRETKLQTYYASFTGYAGFVNDQQIIGVLEDLRLQREAGIRIEYLFVDKSFRVPDLYVGLYESVDPKRIQSLLGTKDTHYRAVLSTRKGVLNSASFTEELAGYLLSQYPHRFTLYEHSTVERVVFQGTKVLVHTMHNTVEAHAVVLCTNGYHACPVIGVDGTEIKTAQSVRGTVGFMEGFLSPDESYPSAIAYVQSNDHTVPYIYVTRRPYHDRTLICVGGPEQELKDSTYSEHINYLPNAQHMIMDFLERSYADERRFVSAFAWQGLMGYTANGIRIVGRDFNESRLMYNLGCNGVGILPSFAGALRIARILAGERLEASIFDPKTLS